MNLVFADYSPVINATNRSINATNRKRAESQRNFEFAVNAITSIGGEIYKTKQENEQTQVKAKQAEDQTQVKAKQAENQTQWAGINDELKNAIAGMDELFNTTIQNTTSYKDATTGKWITDPAVEQFKNNCINDILNRADLSKEVKEQARQTVQNRFNAYNEIGIANDEKVKANLSAQKLNDDITTGLNQAINYNDINIALKVLDNYNVQGTGRLILEQQIKTNFNKGINEKNVFNISTGEGIEEAYNQIYNGKQFDGLSQKEKDNLFEMANKWSKNSDNNIKTSTANAVTQWLKEDKPITAIYETMLGQTQGLSEHNKNLTMQTTQSVIRSVLTTYTTGLMANLDTMTYTELQEAKQNLKYDKVKFMGVYDNDKEQYSNMDMFDTAMGKIDKEIDKRNTEVNQEFEKLYSMNKSTLVSLVKSGAISGSYAIDSIRNMFLDNGSDEETANSYAKAFVSSIEGIIPTNLKEIYDTRKDSFYRAWGDSNGFKKGKKSDIESNPNFQLAYSYWLGVTADLIMDTANMTGEEFTKQLDRIDNTFLGKYMSNAVFDKVGNVVKTSNDEAQALLKDFETYNPAYYDQNRKQTIYNSDITKENFDNVYLHYKDTLKNLGFDIVQTAPQPIVNGNDVTLLPLFRTTDGKEITVKSNGLVYEVKNGQISTNPITNETITDMALSKQKAEKEAKKQERKSEREKIMLDKMYNNIDYTDNINLRLER